MRSPDAPVRDRTPAGRQAHRWARIGLVTLGVWLAIAPFALAYHPAGVPARATINDVLCGVLVVALGLLSFPAPGPGRGPAREAERPPHR